MIEAAETVGIATEGKEDKWSKTVGMKDIEEAEGDASAEDGNEEAEEATAAVGEWPGGGEEARGCSEGVGAVEMEGKADSEVVGAVVLAVAGVLFPFFFGMIVDGS